MRQSELNNLDPNLLLALAKANEDYKAQTGGQEINFTSGFRTNERQKQIYATARPGYAARPGHSPHEAGNAVDIDPKQIEDVVNKVGGLEQYGLYRPLLHNPKAPENWHVEHLNGPRGGKSVGARGAKIQVAETQPIQLNLDSPEQAQEQAHVSSQPMFYRGNKTKTMEPAMFSDDLFKIPSLGGGPIDTSDIKTAGSNPDFLTQLASALGAGKTAGASPSGGNLPGTIGATIGTIAGGPVGGAIGQGLGELGGDIVKMLMLNKTNKMAQQHAGWLQDIAANPPNRPGWVNRG